MNKSEFIKAISEKAGSNIKDTSAIFDATISVITETLASGNKISLIGFGNLELKDKQEREGVNPLTGEKVTIAASKAPNLKFSKSYKENFNK